MERFIGIIGILVIFAIVFAMSNNRKAINYKTVGTHGSYAWRGHGNCHASGLSVLLWINPI